MSEVLNPGADYFPPAGALCALFVEKASDTAAGLCVSLVTYSPISDGVCICRTLGAFSFGGAAVSALSEAVVVGKPSLLPGFEYALFPCAVGVGLLPAP